ncbi:uncharacterized protein A4U43_C01F8320 [Asparagus officinalis]|uniref:Aquaporin n=1 Tax=Asparagus officinalis TaxID=4686 RepID=A0A5P1FRM5_ASPOF|nr:uncharacterized protein A4U43_C01F8320 [Asparagus officinalis]
MKVLVGSPGTVSGLVLRLGQCLFAGASIGVMVSALGFSNYTAFCFDLDRDNFGNPIGAKQQYHKNFILVLAPLPIGFAVFMVHLATIPITGTGINPARSFGAAVIYNTDKAWDDQWIFWVGPFIGAAIAAAYHQIVLRAGAVKALGSFRSNPSTA